MGPRLTHRPCHHGTRHWRRRLRALVAGLLALAWTAGVGAADLADLGEGWPAPEAVREIAGQDVTFASQSPFTLRDVGVDSPPTAALGRLFLPAHASATRPAPAVILLHGAGGMISRREPLYARQLAAMGIAALIVDAFAARRDFARGFTERLINITETMLIADAHAGLRFLAGLPSVDAERVALVGFSYGGMAMTYAAYAQVAERLAPDGLRFAAHVAYYAPCLARFDDNRATGAPVLFLIGDGNAIVDQARCAEVETIVYRDAYHQWDGAFYGPRPIGRNLAPAACASIAPAPRATCGHGCRCSIHSRDG